MNYRCRCFYYSLCILHCWLNCCFIGFIFSCITQQNWLCRYLLMLLLLLLIMAYNLTVVTSTGCTKKHSATTSECSYHLLTSSNAWTNFNDCAKWRERVCVCVGGVDQLMVLNGHLEKQLADSCADVETLRHRVDVLTDDSQATARQHADTVHCLTCKVCLSSL